MEKDQPLIIYLPFNQLRRLLRCVLELRQNFEPLPWCRPGGSPFFRRISARHRGPQPSDEWPLAIWAHEEIVNLTDGFVGIVDDAAPNDFGRAIAGRQLMHIICFPQLVALSLVSLSVRSDPSPRLNQLLPWTRVPCITVTASGGAPAALDSKKTRPAFLHCRLISARLAGPLVEWCEP
jgi:hypothetical protein